MMGRSLGQRARVERIIRDRHGKGESFSSIARLLNLVGEPTPSGRGRWHAATVGKVATEGLPDTQVPPVGAVSSTAAAAAAGITYRQIDYWIRTGAIKPTYDRAGSGTRAWFTAREVDALKMIVEQLEDARRLERYALSGRMWDALTRDDDD